jgi:hypothetical protein
MLVPFFLTTLPPAPRWSLFANRFETTGQRFSHDGSTSESLITSYAWGVAITRVRSVPMQLAISYQRSAGGGQQRSCSL